ncbi:quercetin dioxygenase-like cupin family protein [Allocatelliglobosispora scoriae]|uniref:Quercetin dioxygenase-like cupin family protein n=1 Tax=Allocatelliglobosispora scoriae TaxID=643052 RepID=A0A841BQE2_9ACTN|nr:cupin domain-containing protein [Allocatelliglobosispora scoriae]MBB5869040.1 quercetin dioxygenase-like cupin family protein [Allocatelliglobosispora scoriae]
MQVFDYSTAHKSLVESVEVARFEQYPATLGFPFKAMWYCIPPQDNSPPDRHPEYEFSIAVRGSATVDVNGVRTVVDQGSAFLLDSSEGHTVYNTSPDEALLIFSVYWMPATNSNRCSNDDR